MHGLGNSQSPGDWVLIHKPKRPLSSVDPKSNRAEEFTFIESLREVRSFSWNHSWGFLYLVSTPNSNRSDDLPNTFSERENSSMACKWECSIRFILGTTQPFQFEDALLWWRSSSKNPERQIQRDGYGWDMGSGVAQEKQVGSKRTHICPDNSSIDISLQPSYSLVAMLWLDFT